MPAAKKPTSTLRSFCPIAGALDLIGDRWTLLVIRDLFRGLKRYGEFTASPEGIPTNILAERLVRLEKCGIITSEPYQKNPPRFAYSLTAKGLALKPVLGAVGQWGAQHVPGTRIPPEMAAAMSDT
jgi:DNA-binding HxlR family transcriptional regulator